MNSRKAKLIGLLLLALIAFLYFGRALNGIKPGVTGDGIEYILTTEALYNHGTPDIRYEDAVSFKKAYCAAKGWEHNNMGDVFNQIEEWLRTNNTEDLKGKATLATINTDKHYGYHFFFYSMLNVPGRMIAGKLGADPMKVFQVTNAFFVVITCFFLLFFSPFSLAQTVLMTLSFCFTSIYWYLGWTHTEVFMVCAVTLGMWFFFQEKYYLGIFLVSMAALQYQPVVIVLLYMLIVTVSKKGFNLRNLIRIAAAGLIILWPPLFYLVNFGALNLIGQEEGWISSEFVTFTRVFGFYFDANQGMILGLPLALGIYLTLCLRKWYQMALRREPFDVSSLLIFFLIGMSCVVSTICLWSPVGAVMHRYATWFAAIILVHLFFLLNEFREVVNITCLNYIFVSQAVTVLFFNQYNEKGWNFEKHGVLGAWFIEEHPSLYNPDPQIFIPRTSGIYNFKATASPVIYLKNEEEMVKMAVHQDSLNNLVRYGFSPYQIDKIRSEFKFVNGWAYVNKGDFTLSKTGAELYQILRRQKLSIYEYKIRNNPTWLKQIEQKAKERNQPLDEVIKADAEWVLSHQEAEERARR